VRARGWWVSAALLASAGRAGAEPTKQQCVAANEAAQDLQNSGKLTSARQQLALCATTSCPAVVRQDCVQRLEEVVRTMPTIILAAKHGGDDLVAVHVKMDDAPLVDHLDGNALQVDPGPHHFAFEADGYTRIDREVVVRTGEKDRIVEVELRSVERPTVAVTPTTSEPRTTMPSSAPTRRTLVAPAVISFVAGVAGAVVGGVLTGLWAQAKQDGDAACGVPGSCDPATASGWESEQRDFSIGLGVAFGVAAAGVVLGITFLALGSPKATSVRSAWRGLVVAF
jgi:hypothetical protein